MRRDPLCPHTVPYHAGGMPCPCCAALAAARREERELDEARALLRDLAESDMRCPDCGHAQHDDEQGKHHPGCRIDALLRGVEVRP